MSENTTYIVQKLFEYLYNKYLNLKVQCLTRENGVRWRQDCQYIEDYLEKDIRNYLGDNLQEFFWISSYQYVYVN